MHGKANTNSRIVSMASSTVSKMVKGDSSMDTTKAICEVRADIRKEYYTLTEELLTTARTDRVGRVAIFTSREFSRDAEKHFVETIREREKIHFEFMAIVFPEAFNDHFGHPLPKDYPPHDCTKDDLFAFLLAMNFDILKESQTNALSAEEKDLFNRNKVLVDYELDRHYSTGPHHPEYEDRTGKECRNCHIFEMAIDRLARNVQFNHGEINMDQMNKFMPKFYIGDGTAREAKVEQYRAYMRGFQKQISRRSKEMYYHKQKQLHA